MEMEYPLLFGDTQAHEQNENSNIVFEFLPRKFPRLTRSSIGTDDDGFEFTFSIGARVGGKAFKLHLELIPPAPASLLSLIKCQSAVQHGEASGFRPHQTVNSACENLL